MFDQVKSMLGGFSEAGGDAERRQVPIVGVLPRVSWKNVGMQKWVEISDAGQAAMRAGDR